MSMVCPAVNFHVVFDRITIDLFSRIPPQALTSFIMDEKDLPSSSDESDADFVPKEGEDNSDTGSEVSDDEISEGEESSRKGRKRKKKSKKRGKKVKTDEKEDEKKDSEVTEEKKEIDVDALWADFKKDVSNLENKKTAETSKASSEEIVNKKSSESSPAINLTNSKQKSALKFPAQSKVGGLSKVLNQIGKKDKMSTLQKSKLDWNNFKKSEGIEEEIRTYNRGKDGYLDKQDFLQRTDLRQFEIEKDLRSARRKF